MESTESSLLLRRYAEEGCQEAFALLMRRYVDLVFTAALRRLEGDSAAAEDVVQRVFVELAAQARSLKADSRLGGWLYRCAVRFAADVHKAGLRRRHREIKAVTFSPLPDAPEPEAWEKIGPHLDEAMQRLSTRDRDALILRFFEDRPLRAVGDALGMSEDAAQKRVARALSRLRVLLQRRGVAVTVGGLTAGLTANSVLSAPASLVLSTAPPTTGLLVTFQSIMNAKPLLAVAAVVAVVAIPLSIYVTSHGDEETAARGRLPNAAIRAGTAPSAASPGKTSQPSVVQSSKAQSIEAKPAEPASTERDGPPLPADEREAKTRKSAEEVTQQRYTEKMDRLSRKLGLTPEQIEKIGAYHLAQREKWIEYITGATLEKADPQYYSLEAGYREDVPPALQSLLSEEQLKLYREHDLNKRTNHIEAVTSGEINYLAQRLDLTPPKKDALFERLSDINRTDLFTDLTGVKDLAAIAGQADQDIGRRRTAFATVLDEPEMKVWEEVVAGYRREVLRRFGQRNTASAEPANGSADAKSSNG